MRAGTHTSHKQAFTNNLTKMSQQQSTIPVTTGGQGPRVSQDGGKIQGQQMVPQQQQQGTQMTPFGGQVSNSHWHALIVLMFIGVPACRLEGRKAGYRVNN